jgi:hypothetical protein
MDFSQCLMAALTASLEAEHEGKPQMMTAVRRVAGKLADAAREMNEAQRLMLVRQTAIDRYVRNPGAAPDTYSEFLARTSGVLFHEPPARKRARRARQR